jgi:hypothetical protein
MMAVRGGNQMTTRENLIAALNGETPDQTPYSIYDWFFTQPRYEFDEWRPLFDRGLGLCLHCSTARRVERGVKNTVDCQTEGDRRYTIRRKETSVGTLQSVTINSISAPRLIEWNHEYWIKEPRDYEIWQWIVEHTEVVPRFHEFEEMEERAGDLGVTIVGGGRTPAMSIQVDYAGDERFALDVALGVDELFELYEAERRLFLQMNQVISDGPGRFVKWNENLTIGMLGPKRYAMLLMPVYQEIVPILEAAGKRVMVHYDGRLKAAADQIAEAPFHIIQSLTEPPEGDMMLDDCRAAWPDKALWSNINVGLYSLPPEALRQAVMAMRQRAGKRALAFEISEDVPENWRESVPVVLQTLQDLG